MAPTDRVKAQISKLNASPPNGMKEILTKQMNNVISEVSRYDDTLEDLPTRQTYTSSERHAKVSAEVLADRFAI